MLMFDKDGNIVDPRTATQNYRRPPGPNYDFRTGQYSGQWETPEAPMSGNQGVYLKTAGLSNVPVVPYSSQQSGAPEQQKRYQSSKPSSGNPLLNTAVKEGIKQGAGAIGGEVAGGTPTVTGLDAQGNTTFSDGGVVKPDGTVLKEGSYAQAVKQWGGSAAAAYNFYKAMQSKDDKQKVIGGASAVNQGLMANGAYGAGPGAIVGGALGAANVLGSDMTDKQKAQALRRTGEDAVANYFTAGIWGAAQTLDRAVLGGTTDKLRNKVDKLPVLGWGNQLGDKVTAKALGAVGSKKSGDQVKRDAVRKMLHDAGFFGDPADKDDWSVENADGTSFDIGKDGGARLDDGRRYYEVDTEKQGQAIGAANPLAYLVTGGDEKLATAFAGYFTNAITQGAGAGDMTVANANALDKYKRAGYDTPDKAHAGIDELVKAGKLDPEKAAAFHNGINTVFGTNPKPATGTAQRATSSAPVKKDSGKKRRRDGKRRTYTEQTYTPQEYAPTTTAPMGTPSSYGDSFAQSLANVYASNQGL